ncbi:MAG: kinase/pyrophosphorylase [Bdellovibrionaceae bacterium]|jgi:[pyruvate, water dikinase]-phosphate phosphotransferase / [pyruvate, water dikinase] kinase|nr:kinase/pyrophosphorylase [Pseudobdellovibrionaceae bacterium]
MEFKFVYIISDGTGETASNMAKAALVQYQGVDINIVTRKNVRTIDQISSVIENVYENRGFIIHTLATPKMREELQRLCGEKGIPQIDLLGPLLEELNQFFGSHAHTPTAGLLRTVDKKYFKRIEAIEYTVRHDDGKVLLALDEADIILVGISRTSKTPLSIFLSHKGWKVANIPLIIEASLPKELFEVDQRKIVGLMIDDNALLRIRQKRIEKFGSQPGNDYASIRHIQNEISFANDLFKKNRRWPVFNVTDRALEETAGEIIRIVSSRFNIPTF